MESPCPVHNTDPWVPWLLQESSTAPSSAFWPWLPKMNLYSAVKTPVPQAVVSLQLGPSSQVTSMHCEASEDLMKRWVGRERMAVWTCSHEEAQRLHSENELGWAHGTGPRVTPIPHKVRSHMQRKVMNGKKEETETCQGTHTHTCIYLCIYAPLFLFWCCVCAQCCLTLCNPMDYSPPGSSIHGILQTGILQWVTISFSRRSSQPRDWTCISYIAGRFCITETPGNSSYINLRKVSSKYPNEVKSGIKKRPKSNFF